MTEPIEPGGTDPAPATTHVDRLPTGGQSIIAARALAAPTTVNRAVRTVEVVWSTGARARNFVPPLGLITEELDMSPNAVRMQGLHDGAPVLNTHRSGDARDVVGRVISARLEAGRGIATLQFSSAADVEPLWQRIADGTLRSVSVGYPAPPRPGPEVHERLRVHAGCCACRHQHRHARRLPPAAGAVGAGPGGAVPAHRHHRRLGRHWHPGWQPRSHRPGWRHRAAGAAARR